MFNILKKDNLSDKIVNSVVNNCLFESAIIYTQRLKGINGIKLSFKDNSYGCRSLKFHIFSNSQENK